MVNIDNCDENHILYLYLFIFLFLIFCYILYSINYNYNYNYYIALWRGIIYGIIANKKDLKRARRSIKKREEQPKIFYYI